MTSSRAQIWAAVIAAVAAIVSAFIGVYYGRPLSQQPQPPAVASNSDDPIDDAPTAAKPSVVLLAVLIGSARNSQAVNLVRTSFSRTEDIAVTVRYQAGEEVTSFPIRLSIRIGNPMFGDRQYEEVADISMPGRGEHTFVVHPDRAWTQDQQLLEVSLEDAEAYSKMITTR